ncbi:unnamed protein product [Heligmosomoides polygyrus]|uniref:Uncharacterized protein n=1 Tax=Heligmosomoides polygyrus TaxID=6339 RepID=A0A3P8AL79_HELPZ|nr:unnamed protein product [Heligmosomoides polygyrus]
MMPVATTDAVEKDYTTAQTNVREVRTVLGEVQQSQLRPRCRKPSEEEEKMDTNTENEAPKFDPSARRDTSSTYAANVASNITLGGLGGIRFPGAFFKKYTGPLWNAWRATSIFIRTDIDMTSKINFWKDGAVCLDKEALQKVLRLAFKLTYDSALKKLKQELAEEENEKRPIKEGPTAFAAPASATLLEKDGHKRLKKDDIFVIVKACDEHVEEGGGDAAYVLGRIWHLKHLFCKICKVIIAHPIS